MKINIDGKENSNKELLWSVRDLCVKHGMNIQGKFPQSKTPGAVKVAELQKK
jgi:hypothetical protein